MKDLLEMLSERSSIKKILAVIGIAGFLAGSIASIYNLRTIFFSSIPDYRGSISNANNANNFNSFIKSHEDKIVYLNVELSGNCAKIENDKEKLFYVANNCDQSDRWFYSANQYQLIGDNNNYLLNYRHGDYILKGSFLIEYTGTWQGTSVFLLKAIPPGDLAASINKF